MPSERSERLIARCVNTEKTYRTARSRVRALKRVTAEFPEGRVTAVVGPSGSGKSSLLRLLAGLDRPDAGSVEVAGVPVHRSSAVALRRLRRTIVGYVFQRPSDNFFAHLTVGEHLLRASRSRSGGVGPPADQVLDILEIARRVDHVPAALSGGEQQRAAIAQVLLRGSRLVIADEPTAELDSASAAGVLRALRGLSAVGVTFILATHDPAVMEAADRIVRLERGEVIPAAEGQHPHAVPARSGDVPGWAAYQPTILEAWGLRKTYRREVETVAAVDGVDLQVKRSEVVGLVGRSGSGKTTLLNIIAGWEGTDEGSVLVAGRPPEPTTSWREIAVLPQKLGLIEEFTVRENVEYPARLTGSLRERTPFVDALLNALGLRDMADRYPREISVGEQQRAALARALVLSPLLMLADEPTAHQDRAFARRILDSVRSAASDGTACLMATHDEDVIAFIDRVLPISDGRIAQQSGA